MAWFWTNQDAQKPQSTNHIALLRYGDTQMAWFWTNQDAQKPQTTNHIALLYSIVTVLWHSNGLILNQSGSRKNPKQPITLLCYIVLLQYCDTQMAWFWANQDAQKPQTTNHIALLRYGDTQMAWFRTNQYAAKSPDQPITLLS